jgi:cell division protein FtsI/penicillin-binding protein 2
MVAVRASTGQVLAAVSLPASEQFDQAMEGEFAPGSTFKVITSTALMEAGLSPSSPASCPPTLTVDGEVFHNAEGDAPVDDLAQAFIESCNTAFIRLASSDLQPG